MMKMFLSLVLFCFLLTACGLKGPLYEPKNDTTALNFTSYQDHRVA
ncbi:putative lipoprotein [Orbus hercynius]|uniref:Putative lipoprotein n=1 Tax=Orbus hercynius TaxID=593135 RepID=A0A495RJH5_9GAMM|nr:lipoprotein [Orbus hercynius]RKS87667.1 putative lipoprotein [Orbus hercynius]